MFKNNFELFQVYGSCVWIICWQVIILQSLPPDKNQSIHSSSKEAFWQFREQRAHIFFPTKCPMSHYTLLLLSKNSFLRRELGLQWSRKMHCLTCLLTQNWRKVPAYLADFPDLAVGFLYEPVSPHLFCFPYKTEGFRNNIAKSITYTSCISCPKYYLTFVSLFKLWVRWQTSEMPQHIFSTFPEYPCASGTTIQGSWW